MFLTVISEDEDVLESSDNSSLKKRSSPQECNNSKERNITKTLKTAKSKEGSNKDSIKKRGKFKPSKYVNSKLFLIINNVVQKIEE